jgi:hypothetical protein
MKTKIVSLLLAFGLSINAAIAGNSVKIGYSSDFFYRGAQKAEESISSSVMLQNSIGGLAASAHLCSNQAVDTGADSYHMGFGINSSFVDELLDGYFGFNHFEDVPGNALSEVELSASFNSALSPKVSVFRDLDDSLYTLELGVSHSVDLSFANLNLNGLIGNTELSDSVDRDYYVLGSSASKPVGDSANLSGSIDYVDAENTDKEFVFGVALAFKF